MTADTDKLLSLARESGGVIEAHEAPGWEVTYVTFSTNTLAALEQRIRQDEREKVIALCHAERVDADSTGNEEDRAYNRAIDHCIEAIRSSGTSESTSSTGEN